MQELNMVEVDEVGGGFPPAVLYYGAVLVSRGVTWVATHPKETLMAVGAVAAFFSE